MMQEHQRSNHIPEESEPLSDERILSQPSDMSAAIKMDTKSTSIAHYQSNNMKEMTF